MLRLLSWINVVLICCVITLAFVIKDTRDMVNHNTQINDLQYKLDIQNNLNCRMSSSLKHSLK